MTAAAAENSYFYFLRAQSPVLELSLDGIASLEQDSLFEEGTLV